MIKFFIPQMMIHLSKLILNTIPFIRDLPFTARKVRLKGNLLRSLLNLKQLLRFLNSFNHTKKFSSNTVIFQRVILIGFKILDLRILTIDYDVLGSHNISIFSA